MVWQAFWVLEERHDSLFVQRKVALCSGLRLPCIVFGLANNTKESNVAPLRDEQVRCDEIDSLAINGKPESSGVTTFLQEACEQVNVLADAVRVGTLLPKDATLQDLTAYFARPVAITAGTLPTSNRNRVYYKDFLNSAALDVFPNGKLRMSGVYGYRSTLVFTLQVAACPFHQGVLSLNWQYGTYHNDPASFIRSSLSQTCTNIPHVRMDLSTDTMVQLRVPYMSPFEYMPIGTGPLMPYGMLALNYVMLTPSVSGTVAPSYQIFMHMEDLELFGAAPNTTTTVALQSGKSLKPVTEEFEQEAYPFSSSTMALSRSVKWISKGIPMLSSIGGPTSWFLEKASGAIRSFGFSRPQVCDPTQKMFRADNIGEQNVDVPTSSQVVGPMSTNTLRHGAVFGGSEVDEMSLRYVLSQWSQITVFNFGTTTTAGTLLYCTPVSPSCYWFRVSTAAPYCNTPPPVIAPATYNSFNPSGLFFFSSMFKYWRGTTRFRFTFSKTKMHGGRVMVNFNPSLSEVSDYTWLGTDPSVSVSTYGVNGPDPFGYSAIFNLRDGNVFEFEVPYISPKPYATFSGYTGVLSMHVVDALQAPSVVSSTVHCMVEVCGGDDFELANPRTILYPTMNTPTPTLQSGKLLSNAPDGLSEYTVGEAITSVKQLISIPKCTPFALAANSKTQAVIPPWFYQPRPSVAMPAPTAHLTESFGFGGNIASCYTFVRGGTDVHVYTMQSNAAGNSWISIAQNSYQGNYTYNFQGPGVNLFSNNPRVINSGVGAVHARLPAYQTMVRYFSHCLNSVSGYGTAWGIKGTQSPFVGYDGVIPTALYNLNIWSNAATNAMMSRSASDDAALALYIGPPALLLLSTNSNSVPYDVDSDIAIYT